MRFGAKRPLVGRTGTPTTLPEMGSEPVNSGGTALVIVRNPCTHDSRVLREARLLRRLGYRPMILGVVSDHERRPSASIDGIPLRRLAPTSPLAWLRSRLRRGDAR